MATNGLNSSSTGLKFTTNEITREIIDNSGRHGFGTLSPATLVHISGSTTPVRIEGLASGTDVRVLASDVNGVMSYRDDVLVSGAIAQNTITLSDIDGTNTSLTVQAVTGVTYGGSWDVALAGSGIIGASPVELPFITSGSYNAGTITLSVNGSDESDITITGIDGTDTFVTGGTYTQGTGVIEVTRNDGTSIPLSGNINLIEAGAIADNVITLTDNLGAATTLTVNAIDDLSYDSSFGLTVGGTGTISSSFELPFITGGTLDIPTGQLSLVMNGGLESDITISGFATSASDTFVTGATFSSGTATLTRNDGNTVDIAGIWTNVPNSALVNDSVTVGTTEIDLGASSTTLAGLTSVTSTAFSGNLTGNVTGNASGTAGSLASAQNFSISGDITASAVSFDGTGAVALSATIDNGAVTNAKLANDSVTVGTTEIDLGASSTTLAGLTSVTSTAFSGNLTGNVTGNASGTAGSLASAQNFSISGDITASAVSFDGTGAVALSATIDNGAVTNAKLANDSVTVGTTEIDLGASSTTLAGLTSVTSTAFSGNLTGNVTGNASGTAGSLASAQNFSISGDITASAVSFDGTGAVALTATIDNDAVVTDKILNGNVTNAKLANSAFTTSGDGTGSSNNSTALGGTLSFTSTDNSAEIVANGAGAIDFSVNAGNISLFEIAGDSGSVTPNGSSTITWIGGTGIDTSVSGDDLTIAIDSSVVTLDGSQTLTNKTINASQLVDSSVTNAKLANSSLTLAGDSGSQTLELGDTSTFSGGDGIGTVAQATDNLVISVDDTFVEVVSRKGANNGYASLDANGRVPSSQLPSSAFEYKGNWNASTNSPTLADGTGDAGDMYRVSVAGSQDLGNGTIDFQVGDYLLYNGAEWDKIDNTDAVSSVNGATGAVVLDSDDIAEGSTNLYDQVVSLSNGTGITTSGTYPNFTITNSDLGSTQNIFKTISLPSGVNPTAGSNTDTLNFTSSDSSVTINGAGSNTVDIVVGASVNTNIFNADGTLGGNRTVTQDSNTLAFTGGDFTVDGTTLVVDESESAVAIGASAPAASAVLEVSSTTKGFLFPRMTETQRDAIGSPATGLLVYQTDGDEGVYIYKSFGWVQVI